MGNEEYGEYPIQRDNQEGAEEDNHDDGLDETEEAHIKRISDAFKFPLPDVEKSLIGLEVINNWNLVVCRIYPSFPY